MGYDTSFYGEFDVSPNLTPNQVEILTDFSRKEMDYPNYPSWRCQWIPTKDGSSIVWDGGDHFYEYVKWMKYLIENFFGPWGCSLNGEVSWSGGDPGDMGKIRIVDNEMSVLRAVTTFVKEDWEEQ